MACADLEISVPQVSGNVTVVPRKGNGREGLILVETSHNPASYVLDKPMTDLLSGVKYEGKIELNPYDLLILEE